MFWLPYFWLDSEKFQQNCDKLYVASKVLEAVVVALREISSSSHPRKNDLPGCCRHRSAVPIVKHEDSHGIECQLVRRLGTGVHQLNLILLRGVKSILVEQCSVPYSPKGAGIIRRHYAVQSLAHINSQFIFGSTTYVPRCMLRDPSFVTR